MGAADLLEVLRAKGFEVGTRQGRLIVTPASQLSCDLLERLRAERTPLLDLIALEHVGRASCDASYRLSDTRRPLVAELEVLHAVLKHKEIVEPDEVAAVLRHAVNDAAEMTWWISQAVALK